jgi:hypothetical protein
MPAGVTLFPAVSTGNSLVSSGLNVLTPELHPSNASNVFVFALPDERRVADINPEHGCGLSKVTPGVCAGKPPIQKGQRSCPFSGASH